MKRALVGAVFAFLLAQNADPQAAVSNLSKSQQAERMRLLPDDDRTWLEFVEPIIFPVERNFFLLLTEPHQREIFREEFWKRREKAGLTPPLGMGYRHRYEELLHRANQVYDGWRQDAGRMVLAHGEPASLEVVEACDLIFRHLEIWTYSNQEGYSSIRHYLFYSIAPLAPRKLWTVGDPDSDVFVPRACRRSFEDLRMDCFFYKNDPCVGSTATCSALCRVYKIYTEVRARQSSPAGGKTERGLALAPPAVATEDLAGLAARFPGISDPRAKPIAVESQKTRPGTAAEVALILEHPLTYEEIRDRILELPPKHRQWLDLAAPLLTTGDLVRFLVISGAERDRFIREFFKRRS